MIWNCHPSESSGEFGEHLPEEGVEECNESERLEANSLPEAKKKCKEIASEYGGTDSEVVPLGKKWFDCRFKVWRD